MRPLTLVLLAGAVCAGAQMHVQKFRTFYPLNDPAVPQAVKVQGGTARVVASDGAVWFATPQGLVREDAQAEVRDRHQFFAGRRYLADDGVEQIISDGARGVWVWTRTGVSHIELRPMTLEDKAEIFEQRIRERHDRHGLVSPSILRVAGNVASNQMRDDDNDGLWTSMYAAAECFRYAVTKSPEALARAKKSIEAVLFLEEVAGRRGFPARSYIEKGEPMPTDGQWHWTSDGKYYWKGDTSSDEIVGHFFIYGVATDLLPDRVLKKRIAETTSRIMDHILDHGYYLIDVSGKPTRWGRWSPEYFQQAPEDSPLNAVEILSFLKTAYHITGNARYRADYAKLAGAMGYARTATRYKELREEINYSDEELAMLSFYNLFLYEKDEKLLNEFYRPALEQWWENMAREQSPLWAYIYSLAQAPSEDVLPGAAWTLYRMPVDTINWSVKNSDRPDVVMDKDKDRFERPQAKTLLPRDELPVMKWNANPFEVDGGDGGRTEDDGAAFLLPYWMGRYQRMLSER